jgi:zinc protease
VIPPNPSVAALVENYKGDAARSEGEEFNPSPANIDTRTTRSELPGGVKLALLPKQTRGGAVNASIRLNFGDERSLKDTDRVSGLTSAMLMRGTKNKTREQIQDTLDKLKSKMNVGGAGAVVAVNIVSTRENLPAVLDLAIEVLREPAFPENELETLRAGDLADLEASKSEPQAVVSRAYGRHWNPYPKGDVRYIPTVDEEREDLTKANIKGIRDFYQGFYGASNAEVSVVGDFDAAAIREQIAKKLDGWKSPKPYTEVLSPFPDKPIPPVNEMFSTPDKENAFFLAGMPIPLKDSDADYPALVLGNYILGSGPSSHLFSRIRVTEGLSYGVGSSLTAPVKSNGGRFVVQAIAAPQNVQKVEASFRDELAKVLRDGYKPEEIMTAKDSWSQQRQIGRAQDGALAGALLGQLHNGRTMAWDADLESKVRALTPEQIRTAMQKYLDPAKMTYMRGGDFTKAAAK